MVLGSVAGVAGVAATDGPDEPDDRGNETDRDTEPVTEEPGQFYSYEELTEGAVRASEDAPASTRRYGQGQLWVRYVPSGIGGMESDPATWQYLEHGTTVERTNVYLGGFLGWDTSEELDVTIVYWEEERDGNGSVVAANQEVQQTSVALTGGYAEEPVSLRSSYDEPRQATMIVEGDDGTAQWNFNVHTSRTAEPVAVDTRADLAMWAAIFLGVSLLITLACMYVARRWHKRATAGPQYPVWIYGALALPVTLISLVFGYRTVLNTVAEAPWVLAPFVALGTTLAAIHWWGDDTRTVGVVDIDLTEPTVHSDGSGNFDIKVTPFTLGEVDGNEGVVLPGFSHYLARTRGAIPEWDIGGDPTVTFNGQGAFDELVFTHPFDDDPIDWKSDGWSFDHLYSPPADQDPPEAGLINQFSYHAGALAWPEIVMFGFILLAGYFVGALVFSAGLLGAAAATVPAFMYLGRPIKGRCEVNAAPATFGNALVSLLAATEEIEDTLEAEYWRDEYLTERGKNVASRKRDDEEESIMAFDRVLEELESGASEDYEEYLSSVDGDGGGVSADD